MIQGHRLAINSVSVSGRYSLALLLILCSTFSVFATSKDFALNVDSMAGVSLKSQMLSDQYLFRTFLKNNTFNRHETFSLNVGDYSGLLQIAENSQPDSGFYRLETVATDKLRTHNIGFISHSDSITLTVIKLPHQPKYEIVETATETTIRRLETLESTPLPAPTPVVSTQQVSINLISRKLTDLAKNNPLPTSYNTIDVLVLFDPRMPGAMLTKYGASANFAARLASADSLINSVFERSGLEVQHNIVGLVPYQPEANLSFPTESAGDILPELATSPQVLRLKDRYQADMVHYIGADDTGICGRAYLANSIDTNNEFSSVYLKYLVGYSRLACLGGGTYAHEMGHNFGFNHDRITLEQSDLGGGNQSDFHIPYGYVEPSGEFYTTLAYGSSCSGLGDALPCLDEAVYSSPDILLVDLPMGVSSTELRAADNTLSAKITTTITAGLNSFSRNASITHTIDAAGTVSMSWPAYLDATDYLITSGDCNGSNYYSSNYFEFAVNSSTNQVNLTAGSGYTNGVCVFAHFQNNAGFPYYALIGRMGINTFNESGSEAYLYPDSNILDLVEQDDSQTFTLTLSDAATSNDSLKLALGISETGNVPPQAEGITALSNWFDYTITGTGTERLLTISLKKGLNTIDNELSSTDERNLYDLPIRIINTDYCEGCVFNTIWLDPQSNQMPVTSAYANSSLELDELAVIEGQVIVTNPKEGSSYDLVQTSVVLLNGFSTTTNSVTTDYGTQLLLNFSGQVPIIDQQETLELAIQTSQPNFQPTTFAYQLNTGTFIPVINAVDGNAVIEGDPTRLAFNVSDEDENIDWNSATLEVTTGQDTSGADIIQSVTINSYDVASSTITFNDIELAIGQYAFRVTVSDLEGSQAVLNDTIVVSENLPPTINSLTTSEATLVETREFTLISEVTDPENEPLSYIWEALNGAVVNLATPQESTTVVEGLSPGDYQFQLTATDPRGASATSSLTVTVLENQIPQVSASVSPSSPLTTSSVRLSSTASDNDGEIVAYNWQQTSGVDISIADPTLQSIELGALQQGNYAFDVTVTDDIGATASASVSFTVSAPPEPTPQPATSGGGGSLNPNLLAIFIVVWWLRRRIG